VLWRIYQSCKDGWGRTPIRDSNLYGLVFQSYQSITAFRTNDEKVYLDVDWITLGPREVQEKVSGEDKKATEKKIKEGVYSGGNLN